MAEEPGTYLLTDYLVWSSIRLGPSSSWASTAIPSCATTTSVSTGGWCGWRRPPRSELRGEAAQQAAGTSACRSTGSG